MLTNLQDVGRIIATRMFFELGEPEDPYLIIPEVERILKALKWAPNATTGARMTETMTEAAIKRIKREMAAKPAP